MEKGEGLICVIFIMNKALLNRVFRFTLKLEFRFEAWGAHADRYGRATDPKKIYRPINDSIPAIFVFNGNFNGEMARF